ncbi:MAG: 30S ribosomal protein S9 [archaeon]
MASKIVVTSGKRKSAIARAVARPGSGIVRVNSTRLEHYEPFLARQKLLEPLTLAGDIVKKIDISITVRGGGAIGQADAARLAISKALVEYSEDPSLRERFLAYDRALVVADPRRKETRKPGPSTARTSAQKSKR